MSREFIVKHGLVSKDNVTVYGSVTSSLGFYGTASNATSASNADTASNASNADTASYILSTNIIGNVTAFSSSWASASLSSSIATNLSGGSVIATTGQFNNGLTVNGVLSATQFSGSQIYITSSQLTITDNILTLNAYTPHLRYAGIEMWDSGSTDQMASILWDGENNYFFASSSDAGYSRKIITGPDNEGNLTNKYIPLNTGSNGLIDSIIKQDGGSIIINGSISCSVITASGILIGSSADNSASLYISGSGNKNIIEVDRFDGNEVFIINSSGSVIIGNSTTINSSNPEKLLIDTTGSNTVNAIGVYGNLNSYLQINVKNRSGSVNASSDIVATNDTGNESGNFVDLGINSSGYGGSMVGQSNDGYLYNTGSNFYIGNTSPNKNLYLFAGGTTNTASMMISSSGNVGINTTTPVAKFQVYGNSYLGGDTVATNTTPLSSIIMGSNANSGSTTATSGSNLILGGGIGRNYYTILSGSLLSGSTITLTVNGTATTFTAGNTGSRMFNVSSSNYETAVSMSGIINSSGSGITSTYSGSASLPTRNAYVFVTPNVGTYALTLATNAGATTASVVSGNMGNIIFPNNSTIIGPSYIKAPSATVLILGNLDGTPLLVGSSNISVIGYAIFNAGTVGTVPLQVRGSNANQTADLQQWQNADGTVVYASVSARGAITSSTALITGSSASSLLQVSSPTNANILSISGSGNVGIGTNAPISLLHISGSTQTPVSVISNLNNFSELYIQNQNNGSTGSSDIAITNDIGNTGSYYIDMGINSSGYKYGFVGGASDAYLFSTGSLSSSLYIGNINPSGSLAIFVGGYSNTGSAGIIINPNSITASFPISGTISNAKTASYITYNTSSAAPSNPITPVQWIPMTLRGSNYYIPLYQ